jgi:hypothetical protein
MSQAVTEFLVTTAQVGVALAGFSGLIAAIRTASPEGWHPRDIWSLAWMLGTSMGALMFALLPMWLSLFDWSDARVYRLASAILALYTFVLAGVLARAGRRLTRNGYPPRVPLFPFVLVSLMLVSASAATIGALGGWGDALVAVYAGCIVALLLASVLVLAIFLVLLARMARIG